MRRELPEALIVVAAILAGFAVTVLVLGVVTALLALVLSTAWNLVGADLFSMAKITYTQALFVSLALIFLSSFLRR